MKTFLVTGAAGFIGSNLVDKLLELNYTVIGVDNFSTGKLKNLESAKNSKDFQFFEIDLLDTESIKKVFFDSKIDAVFHLAANADVKDGLSHPERDLQQNTIATFNVLEAMRLSEVKNILFSSTGSIYGEASVFPTPEDHPFPIQTSLYGASKLACEGLIQAYCEGYNFNSWIFRFVGILGPRYSHGHVIDFIKKLKSDPDKLEILGDGLQKKSYLHVSDCIEAMLCSYKEAKSNINIINLGLDEYCNVNESAELIINALKLDPKITHTGGKRGWIGDNPYIFLDNSKIRSLGWNPTYNLHDSIIDTVKYLIEHLA